MYYYYCYVMFFTYHMYFLFLSTDLYAHRYTHKRVVILKSYINTVFLYKSLAWRVAAILHGLTWRYMAYMNSASHPVKQLAYCKTAFYRKC